MLHNIGLVALDEPLEYTPYVLPVCLSNDTAQYAYYYIAGWGRMSTYGMMQFQHLQVNLCLSNSYCSLEGSHKVHGLII